MLCGLANMPDSSSSWLWHSGAALAKIRTEAVMGLVQAEADVAGHRAPNCRRLTIQIGAPITFHYGVGQVEWGNCAPVPGVLVATCAFRTSRPSWQACRANTRRRKGGY